MNCSGAMSGDADKFKAFLDTYTPAQVDQLLEDAITEMNAEIAGGSLSGENGVSVITSGQYGLSHAIQVNLALTKIQEEGNLTQHELRCSAFLTVAYYYARELDARGTTDVGSWNLDSRWDFLAPLLYAREFLFI